MPSPPMGVPQDWTAPKPRFGGKLLDTLQSNRFWSSPYKLDMRLGIYNPPGEEYWPDDPVQSPYTDAVGGSGSDSATRRIYYRWSLNHVKVTYLSARDPSPPGWTWVSGASIYLYDIGPWPGEWPEKPTQIGAPTGFISDPIIGETYTFPLERDLDEQLICIFVYGTDTYLDPHGNESTSNFSYVTVTPWHIKT